MVKLNPPALAGADANIAVPIKAAAATPYFSRDFIFFSVPVLRIITRGA